MATYLRNFLIDKMDLSIEKRKIYYDKFDVNNDLKRYLSPFFSTSFPRMCTNHLCIQIKSVNQVITANATRLPFENCVEQESWIMAGIESSVGEPLVIPLEKILNNSWPGYYIPPSNNLIYIHLCNWNVCTRLGPACILVILVTLSARDLVYY